MACLAFWTRVREYANAKVRDAYMARYFHERCCPNCHRWTSETGGASACRDDGPLHDIMTCSACGHESRWRVEGPVVLLDPSALPCNRSPS